MSTQFHEFFFKAVSTHRTGLENWGVFRLTESNLSAPSVQRRRCWAKTPARAGLFTLAQSKFCPDRHAQSRYWIWRDFCRFISQNYKWRCYFGLIWGEIRRIFFEAFFKGNMEARSWLLGLAQRDNLKVLFHEIVANFLKRFLGIFLSFCSFFGRFLRQFWIDFLHFSLICDQTLQVKPVLTRISKLK